MAHEQKVRAAPPRRPAAIVLREAIERAELDGVARTDMTLRLTHRDAEELKRDPNVALEDIRFSEGVMTFLGVKVTPGGVNASSLDRAAE
ncbi:MAG: hypothetical protein JWQ46_1051 [Phenylobacterium sp.]|nr:hypothetical protein [Phenylobacterium sp.]